VIRNFRFADQSEVFCRSSISRRIPNFLDCRKQKRNQHSYDRNHYKKFNQSKSRAHVSTSDFCGIHSALLSREMVDR